jgi:succinyl-diaminopimelate desuccinylase
MFKTLDTLLRGLAGREDRVAELQAVLTACHALGPDNGGQGEMEKVRCITNCPTPA